MKSLRSFTSVEESGTTQDVDFVWVWGGGGWVGGVDVDLWDD